MLRNRGEGRVPVLPDPPGRSARAELGPPDVSSELRRECEKLVDTLRRRCPHLTVQTQLPAGKTAPPMEVTEKELQDLVRAAGGATRKRAVTVWADADSELAVHVERTRLALRNGLVLIGVTVECDQTGETEVVVPFAVGSPDQPAGLVAATERRPRGDPRVVVRWGDALTAFAWQSLLDAARVLAASAGSDEDGNRLVPGAITARSDLLAIIPQARHEFDRRPVL